MLVTSAGSILDLGGIGGLTWGDGTLPVPQPPVELIRAVQAVLPGTLLPPDDPHAITAAFTYDSYAVSWVFSAVPGDLTLTQIATSPRPGGRTSPLRAGRPAHTTVPPAPGHSWRR